MATVQFRKSLQPLRLVRRLSGLPQIQRFAKAILLILPIFVLVPWRPQMPKSGLDASWFYVLSYAFRHHWQFGKDIVFTFGPLGMLFSAVYSHSEFPLILAFYITASLLVAVSFLYIGRRLRFLPLLFFYALFIFSISLWNDIFFFTFPVLLLLVGIESIGGPFNPFLLGLIAVYCSIASLTKLSFMFLSLPVVVLVDLYRMRVSKAWPLVSTCFLASYVVLYLAAGQHLSSLWPYLRWSIPVVTGYSSAMALFWRPAEVVAYVALAALPLVGFVRWERGNDAVARALSALALFTVMFTIFKEGFVRHDVHAVSGFLGVGLVASCVAAKSWPGIRHVATRVAVGAYLVIVFVACLWAIKVHSKMAPKPLIQWWISNISANVGGAEKLLAGRSRLDERRRESIDRIRKQFVLPRMSGSVDVYPADQAAVLAYGLDYKPRPVFQSYSAYTPGLLAENSSSLKDPDAPDNVLFTIGPIDLRFPASDDGASWPVLLSRYEVRGVTGSFVWLTKREKPEAIAFRQLAEAAVGEGAAASVPDPGKVVWMSADIRLNWLGWLAGVLFKPPIVWMKVTYLTGGSYSFRVIPAVARVGFLLSPEASNRYQFAALALGRPAGAGRKIRSISFSAGRFGELLYHWPVHVRFSELTGLKGVEENHGGGPEPGRLSGFGTLLQLIDGAVKVTVPATLVDVAGNAGVFAHAPSILALKGVQGREVDVGYGILDGAWKQGQTDGVCFSVVGQDRKLERVLWSRCLRPRTVPGDRGVQHAVIKLGKGAPEELLFKTDMGGNGNWDWAYWTDVKVK